MNIEPLYELKERLNTSAVAGISLMPEDFRLKRAMEQMEPLSKAAPIFAKIYQGALHILEVPVEQRADALLDELALVDAVLMTQAVAGIEGELLVVSAGMHERVITNVPYSKVAPAMEALTTTGSGHYSFILDMHEESPESFQDFRIRSALVAGLGAGYSELADRVEQWLSEEDESILPFLKRGFLPNGKKEMVRRIHIIEKIAGAKENSWYLAMLDKAEKDVRETLIYALRHEKKNEDILFDLIKTEKGRGKKAAIWALSYMDSPKIYSYFEKQLGYQSSNKDSIVVQRRANTLWEDGYFYLSKSEQVSNLVAEGINRKLDMLEEQVKNGNHLVVIDERRTISQMLHAMIGKTSDAMLAVYRRLAETNVFSELKNIENQQERLTFPNLYLEAPYIYHQRIGTVFEFSLKYLDRLLTDSILLTTDPKLCQLAQEFYQKYQEPFLTSALIAALLSKEGEQVFSEFSHYLVQDGTKENAAKKAGRYAIMEAFSLLCYDSALDEYVFSIMFQETYLEKWFTVKKKIYGEFDFRWLTLLTDNKIKKDGAFLRRDDKNSCFDNNGMATWDSVLERLICPKDEKNCALLGKYFCDRAFYGRKGRGWEKFRVVGKCHINLEPDVVLQYLKQSGKMRFWEFEELIRNMPMKHEEKIAVIKEIRDLVEKKEIAVTEWYEVRYVQLLDEL